MTCAASPLRRHAAELTEAGATTVITNNTESGTALGSSLLSGLGVARNSQLQYLTRALRKQMDARSDPSAHQGSGPRDEARFRGPRDGAKPTFAAPELVVLMPSRF